MKKNNTAAVRTPHGLDVLLIFVFCITIAAQIGIVFFTHIELKIISFFFWPVMMLFLTAWFYYCAKEKLKISPWLLAVWAVLGGVCYSWYSLQLLYVNYTKDSIFFDTVICIGIFFYFLYFYIFSCERHSFLLFSGKCLGALLVLFPLICYCSFDLKSLLLVMFMNNYSLPMLIVDPKFFYITRRILLQGAFVLLCSAAIFTTIPKVHISGKLRKLCFAGVLLSCLFAIPMCFLILPYKNKLDINADAVFFYQNMKSRKNPICSPKVKIRNNIMPGMYFLIVGESHNYQHPLPPCKTYQSFINKISVHKDFIVFPEAYCLPIPHYEKYTGDSEFEVINILSLPKEKLPIKLLLTTPTLLDICHCCRIKTLWYSNLGCYTPFARIQKFFSDSCNFAQITDSNSYNGKYADKGLQVDSEIVPQLKKLYHRGILGKKNSFMLIQPMGIHRGQLHTPAAFQKHFSAYTKDERHLAELYYDQILEKIVATLTAFPETRAIVYVSDHTWERQHSNSHITMFVYLSPELQQNNPALLSQIKQYAQKKFINSEICELYLKILNITMERKNESVRK